MPKISITLDEVKQIISEYYKKHNVAPCEITTYDGCNIMLETIDGYETVSDNHFIFSFEIERLNF